MRTLGSVMHPDDPVLRQRSPYEIWLMGLTSLNGYAILFGLHTSNAIEATLPDWLVFAWGVCLAVGSTAVLVGIFWRGFIYDSMLIELFGVILFAGAAFAYSIVIFLVSTAPIGAAYAATTIGSFGVASVWRALQIFRRFLFHRRHVHKITNDWGE